MANPVVHRQDGWNAWVLTILALDADRLRGCRLRGGSLSMMQVKHGARLDDALLKVKLVQLGCCHTL